MKNPGVTALLGALCLLAAALRHRFVWGGSLAPLLHAGEAIALALFALLMAVPMSRVATGRVAMSPRVIWTWGVVFTLCALVTPNFLSSDVFDYVLRGRVEAVHGGNPYLVPPARFPDDELRYAEWPEFVMPYGPLSAALQYLVALAGGSIWVGVYLFKLCFAGCHLGCAWLLARASTAPQTFVLWLWNPFVLLELVCSAHNEALMALFLSAMVLALVKERMALATLAFGCVVLTKHGCVAVGPKSSTDTIDWHLDGMRTTLHMNLRELFEEALDL